MSVRSRYQTRSVPSEEVLNYTRRQLHKRHSGHRHRKGRTAAGSTDATQANHQGVSIKIQRERESRYSVDRERKKERKDPISSSRLIYSSIFS